MKITGLSSFPIRIPLKQPFVMSHFTIHFMHYVVVRVETDEGIVGYGEATPSWDVNGETPASVAGFISMIQAKKMTGYTMIGEDISTQAAVEHLIDTVINPQESFALFAENTSAKAALEQAVYDAYCQFAQKPLYQLLGATYQGIPFTKTISIHSVEKTKTEVEKAVGQGYTAIRLKLGKRNACGLPNFDRDIAVVREASKIVNRSGRTIRLIGDANQGYGDAETTIRICHKLEGMLDWLEQPILAHRVYDFVTIKKHVSVPIMADESITSVKDVAVLLELDAVAYLNIKLMKTGGMRGAGHIIRMAKKRGVLCHLGSMIESSLGIVMGCNTFLCHPDLLSTDLNVFTLLKGSLSSGLAIKNNRVFLSQRSTGAGNLRQSNINKYAYDQGIIQT